MANVTVKEVEFKNFGKCIEIENGIVRLVVTVDFGPRIICYSFVDGENIFWEDTERVFFEESSREVFGSPWYIYGGHRFWTAPEAFPKNYYADNEAVAYELLPDGAKFIPNIQKLNEYQYEIEVTLDENSADARVSCTLINHSAQVKSLALWGISAMSQGGVEIVPLPTNDTGFVPNRNLTFWSYSVISDPRVTYGKKFLRLKQDTNADCNFKVGINSTCGRAYYFNHGDIFAKSYDIVSGGNYPDNGSTFETYTNPYFLECESMGELCDIAPHGKITLSERWSLKKGSLPESEDEISALLDSF